MDEVKEEVFSHFLSLYSNQQSARNLDGLVFNSLSHEENLRLCAPFSREGIKDSVWSCDGDKSPGPDGHFSEEVLVFHWERGLSFGGGVFC